MDFAKQLELAYDGASNGFRVFGIKNKYMGCIPETAEVIVKRFRVQHPERGLPWSRLYHQIIVPLMMKWGDALGAACPTHKWKIIDSLVKEDDPIERLTYNGMMLETWRTDSEATFCADMEWLWRNLIKRGQEEPDHDTMAEMMANMANMRRHHEERTFSTDDALPFLTHQLGISEADGRLLIVQYEAYMNRRQRSNHGLPVNQITVAGPRFVLPTWHMVHQAHRGGDVEILVQMADVRFTFLCVYCGNPEKATKRCTACHCVSYCSRACQKMHWATHKPMCKALQSHWNKGGVGYQQENPVLFYPILPGAK